MENPLSDPVELLGRLAREYNQKRGELEAVLNRIPAEETARQIMVQSEVTTGRFRKAQQHLFGQLGALPQDAAHGEITGPLVALCQCFDEMRILLEAALERVAVPPSA